MKERPAAKMVTPGQTGMTPDGEEALREVQEHAARQEEINAKNQVKANKVAALIGGKGYVTDKTWPFLIYQGRQISVSEFYFENNIAIDKFFYAGDWELAIVEFKKRVLGENGIRYAYLTPDKKLADLEIELGL